MAPTTYLDHFNIVKFVARLDFKLLSGLLEVLFKIASPLWSGGALFKVIDMALVVY